MEHRAKIFRGFVGADVMAKTLFFAVLAAVFYVFPLPAFSAATISGTVVSAETGDLVRTGRVEVYNQGGSYLGLAFISNTGTFSYPGLGPGTYYVLTRGTGLLDQLWEGIPCPQGDCIRTSGTPIVISGTETVSIDFVLGVQAEDDVIFKDSFLSR